MLKVYILDRCPYCDGKAYLPAGEASNWKGETYIRYASCQMCEGAGERGKWITLPDFLEMLKQVQCQHEHSSQVGGFHFSDGDVWDDILEVCDDCGANLDRLPQNELISSPDDF